MPLSGSIASAINSVALTVNPAATAGAFPSPFARLPFADKAAVWRILEEDTRQVAELEPGHSLGVVQFVFGVLPAFVNFFAFSEIDVFDPATRTLSAPAGRMGSRRVSRRTHGTGRGVGRLLGLLRRSQGGGGLIRDVIIIGAGGGGPIVAKELAARGLDVLLLEAGPRHADPEREWTHFENETLGRFRWGPADRAKPAWLRDTPYNGINLQISGVGGTTQQYYGNSPRAMPGAFAGYGGADAGAYDVAHLFPFPYDELVPYYEWVEHTLPVQTAAMGTKEAVFFRGAERLGLPLNRTKDIRPRLVPPLTRTPSSNPAVLPGAPPTPAISSGPRPRAARSAATAGRAATSPARRPGTSRPNAPPTTATCPWRSPRAGGSPSGRDVTLVTDAFATRIGTSHQGGETVARSVTWRVGATGETITEEANVIVMAAGTTESPRLWLNSGLPNPNDWVGRGYTDHYVDPVIGEFDDDTGSSRGATMTARADFPGRGSLVNHVFLPAFFALALGYSDAGIAGFYQNGRPDTSGADTSGRVIGNRFAELMSHPDRLFAVGALTDDDVEAQNRVTLSQAYPPDEHGPIPKVFFNHRHRSARTVANREFLVRKAVELLRAAGARAVHRVNLPPIALPPALDHAHGPRRRRLGLRRERRRPGRPAPLHRRQLGAGQQHRRPQPDPHHPGRGDANRRKDFRLGIRWRPLGAPGGAGVLDRSGRDPSSARPGTGWVVCRAWDSLSNVPGGCGGRRRSGASWPRHGCRSTISSLRCS